MNLIFVLNMIGKEGLTFCIRMCYAYSNKYKDTKASELYIQNINIKQVITKGFVIKLLLLFINCFCIFMYVWVHVKCVFYHLCDNILQSSTLFINMKSKQMFFFPFSMIYAIFVLFYNAELLFFNTYST